MLSRFFPILLLVCATSGAEEVKLMFGGAPNPADNSRFPEFRYVSAKDGMFAPKSFLQGWNYNPAGGATFKGLNNGSLPADTILEHGIACRKGSLDVPFKAKKAFVRVWVGDWFSGWHRLWGRDPKIFLRVNGKTVYQERMSSIEQVAREWCKQEDYVYSARDPIWDRLVKPILSVYTVEVSNPKGVVHFDLNNLLLTAMIIASDRDSLEQATARMEKERRAQFAARYPWKPQPAEPMPVHNCKDFILFQKSGLDNIHPWSRPKAEEITETPRVFAARGEQEMIRFGILPLRDLKQLTVTVGDFKGKNGVISTAKCGDFWRERYKERGSESTRGKIDALWRLDPLSYVFQENKPQDAEEGTPRMYTLDMDVPADAAPGDYYAPLTVSADGKILRTAKLRLKVLPFELMYKGAAAYNFQISDNLFWPVRKVGSDRDFRKRLAARVAFLDKYHFHNGFFQPWPSLFCFGEITGTPGNRQFTVTPEQEANWDWWFSRIKPHNDAGYVLVKGYYLFKNLGWRSYPHIFRIIRGKNGQKYDAAMKKQWEADLKDTERLVRQITEFGKRKGYPAFYWYFAGELDNFGLAGTKEFIRLADAIRRAGAISFVTINGPLAYKITPPAADHVWANPASPVDEALKAAIEKHGHKFGTHNCGDTRFQAGFQFWRTGSEGRHQETQFYTDFMLPYVYLPWNYNTAQVYPTREGGERPSLPFLNYRDGRDDYLYLYTLEQKMKKADKNSPAYKEAAAFIDYLKRKIHFDPRKYHAEKFDGIEATATVVETEWNSFSIERYRWRAAMLIMKLEESR